MTWHTCDGKRLADIEIASKARRLAREIAARNAEAKASKPPPKWDADTPLSISPRLKPFIEKIRAEMVEAQKLEDEQYE